jgi:hypothetical protein
MMFLWSTIIATLVGFVSAAAVNRRDSGFKTLSQAQINSTDAYAHYSAAAMCSPQALSYWQCGCAYLTCHPIFFSCGRKGSGAMHDEPVLIHRFPCPAHCDAIKSFELYAYGGGVNQTPSCAHVHQAVKFLIFVICILMLSTGYVGYDSSLDSIMVVHQGNDKKKL